MMKKTIMGDCGCFSPGGCLVGSEEFVHSCGELWNFNPFFCGFKRPGLPCRYCLSFLSKPHGKNTYACAIGWTRYPQDFYIRLALPITGGSGFSETNGHDGGFFTCGVSEKIDETIIIAVFLLRVHDPCTEKGCKTR